MGRSIRDFRIGEIEKELIKTVGLGALVLASFALPSLPLALKPFLKERGEGYLSKVLKKLRDKNVIYLSGDKVKLTKHGKELLKRYNFENIKIQRPKKWDGKWHLVSYDVPRQFNKQRDWFRFVLKNMGFEKIQESLWVHAFPCDEEIALVARSLKINDHIVILEANIIPNEDKMKEIFDLLITI